MSAIERNFSKLYNSPIKSSSKVFSGSFTFLISRNREDTFKILSNTSLINKKLKFAPRIESEVDGETEVETKLIGKKLRWIEKPWRWSYGEYIVSYRVHKENLFHHEFAVIHIEPHLDNPEVSEVTFYYEAEVKSFLMKWVLKLTFQGFGKNYEKTVLSLLEASSDSSLESSGPLVNSIEKKLLAEGIEPKLSRLMASLIVDGDDDEVFKIQLPKISRLWGIPLNKLISPFLKASKLELFDLCWDTVCPHCKGARSRTKHLNDLLFQNLCEPCNLTFELDDVDFIDATFKINERVRIVPNVSFCAAEPYKKGHIFLQEKISPKMKLSFTYLLEEGNYRVRILGGKETLVLQVKDNGRSEHEWNLEMSDILKGVGKSLTLHIENGHDTARNIVFEKIVPPLDYLSPLTIFNSPCFRKLYSSERIAKGIQLKLPTQIILFTDVVDSTKFYQRVGDREAYRQIKLHFEIIDRILQEKKGIIIKTIGDAVMASFPSVKEVFIAAKEMCHEIDNHSEIDFKIRLSVHQGPMIAVNYNTGIDYFGDNVNLSAKLQAISDADEISFSQELLESVEGFYPGIKYEKRPYLESRVGYMVKVSDITD